MVELTSIGGDHRKFKCVPAFIVQGGVNADLSTIRTHFKFSQFFETISQSVVDHCVYTTIGICCRNL